MKKGKEIREAEHTQNGSGDHKTDQQFVNDEAAFAKAIDKGFTDLNLNKDSVLSRSELREAFESLRLIEAHFCVDAASPEELIRLYDSIFEKFDCDHNDPVDRQEFGNEKTMLAIVDDLVVADSNGS